MREIDKKQHSNADEAGILDVLKLNGVSGITQLYEYDFLNILNIR